MLFMLVVVQKCSHLSSSAHRPPYNIFQTIVDSSSTEEEEELHKKMTEKRRIHEKIITRQAPKKKKNSYIWNQMKNWKQQRKQTNAQ